MTVFAVVREPVPEDALLKTYRGGMHPERWRTSDSNARALADGSASSFAVWYVGERTATQLLMFDRYERRRSWFRVVALDRGRTLLQFCIRSCCCTRRRLV